MSDLAAHEVKPEATVAPGICIQRWSCHNDSTHAPHFHNEDAGIRGYCDGRGDEASMYRAAVKALLPVAYWELEATIGETNASIARGLMDGLRPDNPHRALAEGIQALYS